MSESEKKDLFAYLQTLRDVVKSKIIYPLLVNRECQENAHTRHTLKNGLAWWIFAGISLG